MPYHYGSAINPFDIWITGRAYDGLKAVTTVMDEISATPTSPKDKPAPKFAPPKQYAVPGVKSTIFNGDTTVIIWEDGQKTIVVKEPDKPYDPYAAFCSAVCKRLFGSTDKVVKIIRSTDKLAISRAKAAQAAKRKEANRLAAEEREKEAAARRAEADKEAEDCLLRRELMMRHIRKLADEAEKVPSPDGKGGAHDTDS